MNKIELLALAQALLIFLLSMMLLNIIRSKPEKKKIKKKSIYTTFDLKTLVSMIAASAGVTYLLSKVAATGITTFVLFITIIAIAPYMFINNANRKRNEAILNDIILYCQNVTLLLKQTGKVYHSIETVVNDLNTEFKDDIMVLLENFQYSEQIVRETMEDIEKKYPYTCLMQLHIIMLYMNYESERISPALIDTFQDDVSLLDEDIRNNMSVRKAMRIQYFGITAGSILIYYAFCSQLKSMMEGVFTSGSYQVINLVYLFLNIIAVFFIDRYFNAHTSVE